MPSPKDTCLCQCSQPDGACEHRFDGEEEEVEGEGVYYASVRCSKCGMTRMVHDLGRLK